MNQTSPLISIIVPCYNQAEFLSETLQSVLDQSYNNWECIVVDDGSPDNTAEVSKIWQNKDSRFQYIYKPNGGLADARNVGIDTANGEWILPLDSDDKLSQNFLEEIVNMIHIYPNAKLLYPKVFLFGSESRFWNIREYDYDSLLWINMLVCTSAFRKKDFVEVGGYNTEMKGGWEDWDFWLKLLQKKDLVLRLPTAVFYYRRKAESMIEAVNEDIRKKEKLYWQIFNNHPNLYANQQSYISCMLEKRDLQQQNLNILSSITYRVGAFMLWPLSKIKFFFR